MKKFQAVIGFLILLLFVFEFVYSCFAVDINEAEDALSDAELNLILAFKAVDEPANFSVDITKFLDNLDTAGSLLSKAHLAFRAEDYDRSYQFALECSNTLQGIFIDAALLKEEAEKTNTYLLFLTVLGSCIGLILLIVVSFIGWKIIKKWYSKRLLKLKPELEEVQ